jgi:hypothetical protein
MHFHLSDAINETYTSNFKIPVKLLRENVVYYSLYESYM